MLNFNREIVSGSFNKLNKGNKETDYIQVNIKTKDKHIDVNIKGKALFVAGFAAAAPTMICVMGATVAMCAITRLIYKRKQLKEEQRL